MTIKNDQQIDVIEESKQESVFEEPSRPLPPFGAGGIFFNPNNPNNGGQFFPNPNQPLPPLDSTFPFPNQNPQKPPLQQSTKPPKNDIKNKLITPVDDEYVDLDTEFISNIERPEILSFQNYYDIYEQLNQNRYTKFGSFFNETKNRYEIVKKNIEKLLQDSQNTSSEDQEKLNNINELKNKLNNLFYEFQLLKDKLFLNGFSFDKENFKSFLQGLSYKQKAILGKETRETISKTLLENFIQNSLNGKNIDNLLVELNINAESLDQYQNNSSKLFLLFDEIQNIISYHFPLDENTMDGRYIDILSDENFINEKANFPSLETLKNDLESYFTGSQKNNFNKNNTFYSYMEFFSLLESSQELNQPGLQNQDENIIVNTGQNFININEITELQKAKKEKLEILYKYAYFIDNVFFNSFIKTNPYVSLSATIKKYFLNEPKIKIYENKNNSKNILDVFYKKVGGDVLLLNDFYIDETNRILFQNTILSGTNGGTIKTSLQKINENIFNTNENLFINAGLESSNDFYFKKPFDLLMLSNTEGINKFETFLDKIEDYIKNNDLLFNNRTTFINTNTKDLAIFCKLLRTDKNYLTQYVMFLMRMFHSYVDPDIKNQGTVGAKNVKGGGPTRNEKTPEQKKQELIVKLFEQAKKRDTLTNTIEKLTKKYKNNKITIVELRKKLKKKLSGDTFEVVAAGTAIVAATIVTAGAAGLVGTAAGLVGAAATAGTAAAVETGALITGGVATAGTIGAGVLESTQEAEPEDDSSIILTEKTEKSIKQAIYLIETSGLHPDFPEPTLFSGAKGSNPEEKIGSSGLGGTSTQKQILEKDLISKFFSIGNDFTHFIFYTLTETLKKIPKKNILFVEYMSIFSFVNFMAFLIEKKFNITFEKTKSNNNDVLIKINSISFVKKAINDQEEEEILDIEKNIKKEIHIIKKASFFLFEYIRNNFKHLNDFRKKITDLSVDINRLIGLSIVDIDLYNQQEIFNLNSFFDECKTKIESYKLESKIRYFDHYGNDLKFLDDTSKIIHTNFDYLNLFKNDMKIISVGINRYFRKRIIGERNIVKIKLFKSDVSKPQIYFKPKVYLFDLDLYLHSNIDIQRKLNFEYYKFYKYKINQNQIISKEDVLNNFIEEINIIDKREIRKNHFFSKYLENYLNLFYSINTNNIDFSISGDVENIQNTNIIFSTVSGNSNEINAVQNLITSTLNNFSSEDQVLKKIFAAKHFDRIFNILFDSYSFEVDTEKTEEASPGIINNAKTIGYLAQSPNNNAIFVNYDNKDIQVLDRYYVEIETS